MPSDNGNILRVVPRWLWGGTEEVVNVWHLRVISTGAITDADMSTAVNEWLEAAYAIVNDRMSNYNVHYDTQITNLTVGYSFTPLAANTNLNGLDTTDILPSTDCPLVVWRTGVSRRLGRKYLPPTTKTQLASGRWVAGMMTDLNALGTFCELDYVVDPDLSLEPGVRSTLNASWSSFVSHKVSNVPSHVDRRKIGVGS